MVLEVKRLLPNGKLPERSYNSAGYDLYSAVEKIIQPGATKKIELGIACKFPAQYVALVWDRSSLGVAGIHRFAGVIDSDYRGEWAVVLYNSGDVDFIIEIGDKIAQVVFQRFENWPVVEVDELNETSRGVEGFGSTGR